MLEENLGTQAGVRLLEGIRLIWGPLNTDLTVLQSRNQSIINNSIFLVLFARFLVHGIFELSIHQV